jgi:hypothetical protein
MKQGESGDRDDVVPVPAFVPTSLGFLGILENGHDQQSGNPGSASYIGTCLHTYRLLQMTA